MKNSLKVLVVIGLIGLSPSIMSAQHLLEVTFRVHSPGLVDTSAVFVAGSLPELGSWHPGKVQMEYSGNNTWSKTIQTVGETSIEYKFTLGTWDNEAASAEGRPFSNFVLEVKRDTTVVHDILYWKAERRINMGQITGKASYHKQLEGEGLLPRDVIVWLPPGYDPDKKQRYPVLYMHDGQNIVDPATSSFGVDWQIDESIDSLIRIKAVEPLIVVGIYNTSDRGTEYIPGEKGTAYMRFIVETLKPMIDASYRTKPQKKHTFTGGSSAGGLISFMLGWEYPDVFAGTICMSPALKIQHIDYVSEVLKSTRRRNVFYYMDNGGIDLEARLQPGVDEMVKALDNLGYKRNKDYCFISEPSATHNEAAWARRFPAALKRVLKSR